MATNHDEYDLLKNPAVDYDRTDLSPRGILVFLVGLLLAGVFVELVLWGMFHFLARSQFFAKGNASPMLQVQKATPLKAEGADFENTRSVNPEVFPEPRLQTNDVIDMDALLQSERQILYPAQPFADQNGTIHLPINDAMKLIEQRGLPVRPAETGAGTAAEKKSAASSASKEPGAE